MKRLIVWLMIFLCCGVAWAATTTTNYGLYKPAVGDTDWGDLINGNFDTIDTQMKTTADASALNTTHRTDNTQAHSDYLINNGDDATSGTITAGGFIGDLTGNADTSTLSQAVNWTAVEALSPINSAAVNWDDIEVSSPMTTSPASSNCLVGVDASSDLGCYTSFDLSDQTVFYYYDGVTATFKFDASQITPGNERTIYLPDRNATIDKITGSTTTDQDGLLLAASGVIVSNDNFTTTGDTLEMGIGGTFSVLGEIDASSGSVILPSNVVQSADVNWTDLEVLGPINGASVNWTDLETLSRINGAAINWTDLESIARINNAAINWADMTDLASGGSVTWGNIAEGELADSTVVSADIKDGTITTSDLATATITPSVCFIIDGGGSAITTGEKAWVRASTAFTIGGVEITADQSGSCVVDIWKDTYANFPPTNDDSITASAPPTLSTAQKNQDTTLTGWTKTVSVGDYLRANVDSCSTVKMVEVCIYE